MKTETLIDFWRSIFDVVKERQEQGLPTTYKDVIFYDLGLVNIRFNSIPDLVGVDVDDEIVYEFLRRSMVPKDVRFDADLQDITMPGEIWETIPGFSRYKVSTFGRVWSTYHGKVMAPQMSKKRYQALLLRPDDGEPRRVYVHRLVAQVFIPNPEGCDTVDHIDENHINNHVSNLRWVTSRENMELYMKNHGYWYNQELYFSFPQWLFLLF